MAYWMIEPKRFGEHLDTGAGGIKRALPDERSGGRQLSLVVTGWPMAGGDDQTRQGLARRRRRERRRSRGADDECHGTQFSRVVVTRRGADRVFGPARRRMECLGGVAPYARQPATDAIHRAE